MKKIIAAFDALKLSNSTIDYSLHIAKEISATITGVFVEDIPSTTADTPVRTIGETRKINAGHRKDRMTVIKTFEKNCIEDDVNYTICRDNMFPTQELLHESIYADLMVVDVNETFTQYPQFPPTRSICQLMSETQCPILVVPEQYAPIKKVILLYDGSPSSVYAIKMFTYLFKELLPLETEVVTARQSDDDVQPSNGKLMKEFLSRHFPQAGYTMLRGLPEEAITEYIARQQNDALIVMGGHQRSNVVRSFKQTLTDALLKKLRTPLFIAFNK